MNRPEAATSLRDKQREKQAEEKSAGKTDSLFSHRDEDRHFCVSELKFTRLNEANNSFVLGYN